MPVIEGEVLAESLNIQVVKRPKHHRPRYVAVHLQSEQVMPLEDALTNRQYWAHFIPEADDLAVINSCAHHVEATVKAIKDKQAKLKTGLRFVVDD